MIFVDDLNARMGSDYALLAHMMGKYSFGGVIITMKGLWISVASISTSLEVHCSRVEPAKWSTPFQLIDGVHLVRSGQTSRSVVNSGVFRMYETREAQT